MLHPEADSVNDESVRGLDRLVGPRQREPHRVGVHPPFGTNVVAFHATETTFSLASRRCADSMTTSGRSSP
jgi:hypothetical protein